MIVGYHNAKNVYRLALLVQMESVVHPALLEGMGLIACAIREHMIKMELALHVVINAVLVIIPIQNVHLVH